MPQHLIGRDAFQSRCVRHHAVVHQAHYLSEERQRISANDPRAFHMRRAGGRDRRWILQDVMRGEAAYHAGDCHLQWLQSEYRGAPGGIRKAAQMIWAAERPYITRVAASWLRGVGRIASSPNRSAGGQTLMGLGSLPSEHPNCINMLGCTAAMRPTGRHQRRLTDRAQGAVRRPGDWTPGGLRAARQGVHVDIDPAELGRTGRRMCRSWAM
jgi:thiamine pyrophosphate-dependent acetolactate synthase large subunit-like protein